MRAAKRMNVFMRTGFALLGIVGVLSLATSAHADSIDLAITKTDGAVTAVPGTGTNYTITVTTASGAGTVTALVQDNFPGTLSGVTWTCTPAGGASCTGAGAGNISDNVTIPFGGSLSYAVSATISSTATGVLSNTATVAVTGIHTDPGAGNNSATDNTTLTPQTDPSITKTDSQASDVPGTGITYTVEVTNGGPSAETAATVVDNFPASLSGITWTCVASGGANCNGGAGVGNINRVVNLGTSGTVTFTVSATIDPCATGTLTNTATVAAANDTNAGNNSATDNTTLTPQANLQITKTDGQASDTPGTGTTYTIEVTNLGPSCDPSATVTDNFPASLTGVSWSCVAAGGASCGSAGGAGNISQNDDLGSGGTTTYTVTATIDPDTTGTLSNTASVASSVTDLVAGNNSATDNTSMTPAVSLSATKTDSQATAVPGTPTSYVITVTNAGPSSEPAAEIIDNFPAALNNVTWTCSAAGTAICPNANGSGDINETADLGDNGTLTYNVDADIDDCSTGNLANTVTVNRSAGVSGSNTSATDNTTLTPIADLSIIKVDDIDPILICNRFNYTVTVTNNGPSCATNVVVTDTLQPEMTFLSTTPGNPTCNTAGQIATCNLGTILAGGVEVINLEILATDWFAKGDTNANVVSVTAAVTDPEPLNDSDSEDTKIKHSEPYKMTLTASPRFMRIGLLQSREYLLKVRSLCDPIVTTTNAVIDLTIADGENIDSSIPAATSQLGNQLTYNIPAIQGREILQFVVNTSLVDGTQPNNNMRSFTSINDDFINVGADEWTGGLRGAYTASADDELSLLLTAPRTVLAGESLHMTVSAGNASRLAASDVIVTVQGPSDFGLITANPLPQSTVVLGDRVNYDWIVGLVAGPGAANQTLDFEVPADTPDGTVLSFQGDVSDNIGRSDGDTREVIVRQPGVAGTDVVLFTDHTAPNSVLVGSTLRTTVTVNNAGRADATDVEATLDGPSAVNFVSSTPAPSSIDTIDSRTIIRWNLGTVNGPGHSRITVNHNVPVSVDVDAELQFDVSATDGLGNIASSSTTVTARD